MYDSIQDQVSASPAAPDDVILSPEMPVPIAVQRIIKHQNIQFKRMLPVAFLGEDIEGVHKVRVSLRRMRTCLKITRPYFQKKNLVATRIDLKFVRQVFGRVRDMDVFKQKYSLHIGETAPAEDFNLLVWQPVFSQTYQDYTAQIRSAVTQDIISQLKQTLAEFETSPAVLKKPEKLAALPENLSGFLPISMNAQLSSILNYEVGMETDRQYPRHHQLRLRIKAHRYTYEFFRSILNQESTARAIDLLIKLQDHLGELNDCVQAIRLLRSHQSPRLSSETSELLSTYIQYQEAKQNALVASFPALWEDFLHNDLEAMLKASLALL